MRAADTYACRIGQVPQPPGRGWGAQRANPVYRARYQQLTSREQNKLTATQAQTVIAAGTNPVTATQGQTTDEALAKSLTQNDSRACTGDHAQR